jgi:uncharacterized protein (DUF433 family)
MKKNIQVPVAEITADLQRGISDEEPMKKFGLSKVGLKRCFENLMRAVSIGSEQIQVEVEVKE